MEKFVVGTEKAPGPFQGAPYSQAIRVGDLVFVAGQLGLKLGDTAVEGDVATQTEQVSRDRHRTLLFCPQTTHAL